MFQLQNICPEGEWDNFVTVLQSDLPTSFRITASCDTEAKALLKMVEGVFFTDLLKGELNDEQKHSKPFCLPWCVLYIFGKLFIFYKLMLWNLLGIRNDWGGS